MRKDFRWVPHILKERLEVLAEAEAVGEEPEDSPNIAHLRGQNLIKSSEKEGNFFVSKKRGELRKAAINFVLNGKEDMILTQVDVQKAKTPGELLVQHWDPDLH